MAREDILILKRRFTGRVLESALLILAVALGVGAASSGLSIFFHTKTSGEKTLSSPEYREIIVTSRENIKDMESPLLEMTQGEEAVLTTKDLEAGELVPAVTYSYIISNGKLRLNTDNREPGAPGDRLQNEQADFESSSDIIKTEIEEISGYEVTREFFYARGLDTSKGSIFTDSEYTSSETSIILGSEIAAKLEKETGGEIVGKKLASRNRLYNVVGILEETNTSIDNYLCNDVILCSEPFFSLLKDCEW